MKDLKLLSLITIILVTGTMGTGFAGGLFSGAFKTSPYLIRNNANENILKFRLGKSQNLTIIGHDTSVKGVQKTIVSTTSSYQKDEVHEVNLGSVPCDHFFSYVIKTAEVGKEEKVLAENKLAAVPCNPKNQLVIGFLADTQQNTGHDDLAKVILKQHESDKINFLINGGDVVHYGAVEDEWKKHFKIAQKYYQKLPVVAALGNHEYWYSHFSRGSSALFKKYLRSENDSPTTELHLKFPQIDVIIFNSNFTWMNQEVYANHLKWLDAALKDAKDNGKKAIVVMHHSPFTSGSGNEETEAITIRKEIIPIFEKHKNVPLVLSGHVHTYERALKNDINYLVAGPAGGCKYKVVSRNPFSQFIDDQARTFSVLKIDQSNIKIKTYDKRNALVDQYNIPL